MIARPTLPLPITAPDPADVEISDEAATLVAALLLGVVDDEQGGGATDPASNMDRTKNPPNTAGTVGG